jgi:RNA polymerase sigma factor (sigma-70 family)
MNSVMQQLRRAVLRSEGARVSDGQLLEAFITRRDEAAFETLVRRYGPMVLGVCRRVLANAHDAEDAFQAAFLVLVRKAASLRSRELVGNWLYGVAYRTAMKAKSMAVRRRAREREIPMRTPPEGPPDHDLLSLLDQELERLPGKYREPIVLCDLEGRSRKEAARLLHIAEGTLSSRLATARNRLARRLARHSPALSTIVLGAVLAQSTAVARVPASLLVGTVRCATAFAAGHAIPANLAALTEGVIATMLLSKLKILMALVLGVCLVGSAAGGLAFMAPAGSPAAPQTFDQAALADADETKDDRDGNEKSGQGKSKEGPITGSGKAATKQIEIADFTSVDVSAAFQVQITRGDSFRVTLTGDDNLLPYVKIAKKGGALTIGLDTHRRSIRTHTPLKVAVTMPALEGVRASGATRVSLSGFKSNKSFHGNLTGASVLTGTIGAGDVDIIATGASKISLRGSARRITIKGVGATHIDLAGLAAGGAQVTLVGASHATIHAKDKLDYTLTGASHLTYRGKPAVGSAKVSGASHASRK